MLGIRFIKVNPTTHLIAYRRGNVVRQGPGLSLLYYSPTMSLVALPLESREVPFIFEKVTADFQAVSVQGQLSYRVAAPERTAASLNFTLLPNGKGYESKDPGKLSDRVVAIAQVLVQQQVQGRALSEAIRSAVQLSDSVLKGLRQHPELAALGVEVQGLAILAVKPTPDTARALEAKAREAILREADDAIFARRNAAVENERAIKESELDTEVAIEQKRRTIRETQMEAEASVHRQQAALEQADMEASIRLEDQRKELVQSTNENLRATAAVEAERITAIVQALGAADPKVIQALAAMGMQPSQLIAQAFGGLAENAGRIGQLNLSPDLLQSLLSPPPARTQARGN